DPVQHRAAEGVIRQVVLTRTVDLKHDQLRRFEDWGFEKFYESCDTVRLGATSVKVLGCEDQVRFLCLHFLKHGGWRPIWRCDVAIALDSHHGGFDWRRCLGTNPKFAQWVGSTIALARELLDARMPDGAPLAVTPTPPKWLKRTVLREWSDPYPPSAPS